MDNKYVYAVVGGLLLALWAWVGLAPYYAAEGGGISHPYIFAAVLVFALGGGNSDGSDLVSTIIGAITGFVPKFIGLIIAWILATIVLDLVGDGFNVDNVIEGLATVVASGVLAIATMACLKKSG